MTGVMGFLAQCEVCPQKAILTDQPDGWVCPRCVEVTAPAFAVEPVRTWCCGTGLTQPHVTGCSFAATEGNPIDYAGPYVQRGDRVAVQMPDGTLRAGPYNTDSLAADEGADTLERGLRTVESLVAFAEQMAGNPYGVGGFGDVDVAAADPIPEPLPLTIPIDDPLAVAILAEVDRNPHGPLITTFVNGRVFRLGGYTIAKGAPLSTVWVDEQKLRLASSLLDEAELPYRPPVKDRAYRAPITALADDEPDYGSIRG